MRELVAPEDRKSRPPHTVPPRYRLARWWRTIENFPPQWVFINHPSKHVLRQQSALVSSSRERPASLSAREVICEGWWTKMYQQFPVNVQDYTAIHIHSFCCLHSDTNITTKCHKRIVELHYCLN